MEEPSRLVRLAIDVDRAGLIRTLALRLRIAVFPPQSRREALYVRLLRPLAGRLAAPSRKPARLGPYAVWAPPTGWLGSDAPVGTILVVKLDHIGDFLLAAPSFGLLRRAFAGARITLLCAPWTADLARRCGLFDAVETLTVFAAQAEQPPSTPDADALGRLGPFDLAIDLRVDSDTRGVLSHIAARVKAGYQAGAADLDIVLPQPDIRPARRHSLRDHQRQLMLNLVAAVIARFEPARDTAGVVRALCEPCDTAAWLRPLLVMQTGSGRAIKNWPLERFIALAQDLVAASGGTLVLLGSPEQQQDAGRVQAALGTLRVVNLVGRLSLAQSMGVVEAADLFIGNDSGLGHASAALGNPTLILFSGIDALPSWAPLGPRAIAIKREVSCSPCHLSRLALCRHAHACMTGIELAVVRDHADRLLAGAELSA